MSWDLAIPPWEALAIIAMIIALIYALWRSMVWDHEMHMKELTIRRLMREVEDLREEIFECENNPNFHGHSYPKEQRDGRHA